MDTFSILIVAMGCVVTAMLLIGFIREVVQNRPRNRLQSRPQNPTDPAEPE